MYSVRSVLNVLELQKHENKERIRHFSLVPFLPIKYLFEAEHLESDTKLQLHNVYNMFTSN